MSATSTCPGRITSSILARELAGGDVLAEQVGGSYENPRRQLPPGGNTGGKLTRPSVCVDWLNCTFPVEYRETMVEYLKQFLGEAFDLGYGVNTYKNAVRFASGGLVCWAEGRREALISLNGESMGFFDAPQLLKMVKDFRGMGGKFTRLDLAWNDYERIVPLARVHAAAKARNFTGFRTYLPIQPERDGELIGDSATFGKVGKDGSGRYICWYDKELESKGKHKGNRLEVRYFKDLSNIVAAEFGECENPAELGVKIGKLIGGAIDFIDRGDGTEKHISRLPRLRWWQRVRDLLGAADVRIERSIPPLEDFVDHFRKTCAPSLAMVRQVIEAQGADYLAILLEMSDEGESRINWRSMAKRDLGINMQRCFGRELASIEARANKAFSPLQEIYR